MNHLVWRMSTPTWQRLTELWSRLEFASPDTDEHQWLKEEIKRLPGFPAHADEFTDMIHYEVIDQPTSHGGLPQ